MEILNRERKQLRRLFTKSQNELESKLFSEPVIIEELIPASKVLEDKANRLFQLDEEIKSLWLEQRDFNEEEFQEDVDDAENYREQWINLKAKLDILQNLKHEKTLDNKNLTSTSPLHSFKKAKVQETPSLNNASPVLHTSLRRHKRPARYQNGGSISDDEPVMRKTKKFTTPITPTVTSVSTPKNKGVTQISKDSEYTVSGSSETTWRKLPKLVSVSCSTQTEMDSSESLCRKAPDETSKSDSIESAMLNQVFKYMDTMHSQLKELNVKFENINSQLDWVIRSNEENKVITVQSYLPEGIELPATTEEKLHQLNEDLRNNEDLSAALVRYLHDVANGKSLRSYVLSITKKVLSQEVAMQYSRFGRKGKKSFSRFSETLNVILAAAALKFKDADREDIFDMFGLGLAGARDWHGRKKFDSIDDI